MDFILEKAQRLQGRDIGFDDHDDLDGDESWWFSTGASAVKWSIVGIIFLIAVLWFIGGYYHAQRRMKNGLPPLLYHKWLLPRSQRARFHQQNQAFYQQQDGQNEAYQFQPYPAPPPAYNPTHMPPPPMYQPPARASKINPSQEWNVPPPGPPLVGESSTSNQPSGSRPDQEPSGVALEAGTGEQAALPVRPAKPTLFSRLKFFK